ncbi:hypothetical protein BLX06_13805 [Bacillus cereus]|uniref:Uncharacterized protein n=1 Tax=Bacillus cereus TaxID=1396 RepID=A0A9X6B8N8_BACCE|nr:hypothetical protein BLX06_13805 [Bacillus cereus]
MIKKKKRTKSNIESIERAHSVGCALFFIDVNKVKSTKKYHFLFVWYSKILRDSVLKKSHILQIVVFLMTCQV